MTDRERRERVKHRRLLVRQIEASGLALEKTVASLKGLDPADIPEYMLAKMLETASAVAIAALHELRQLDAEGRVESDPWEAIARELDPAAGTSTTVG